MNAPTNDDLLAAVSRRLLNLSKSLELLARAMRRTLPPAVLADVWRAQGIAHRAALAAHPRAAVLPEVPETFENKSEDGG